MINIRPILHPCDKPNDRDRGFVLLNALIVISVVAAIAAHLMRADLESRNRFELMVRSDQARVHALSAEALVMELLAQDASANEVDHLGESWAEGDRSFNIEGAVLTGRLIDLQGRLNVNQLLAPVRDEEEGAPARLRVSDPEMRVFRSMIKQAGGPQTLGVRAAEWISDKVDGLPGAAGDAPYLKQDTPFLRPAQPVMSARDLRLVEGMNGAVMAYLLKGLSALPEPVSLNVNTAPKEVLQAMMPGLNDAQMARLMQRRQSTPFQSRGEFEAYLGGIVPPASFDDITALDLDVKTNWFLLEVEVVHGKSRAALYSVIRRPDGGSAPSVLMRSGAAI